MIHLIKSSGGHNAFIDFGDLDEDQISELLSIARARTRATMPEVTFPENSDEKTEPYTSLVKPKYFFAKGDLQAPKVLAFKSLGETVLNQIAAATEKKISEKLAKIEAKENKAIEAAEKESGEVLDEDERKAYRDTHGRAYIEKKQEVLDAFRKATKVL